MMVYLSDDWQVGWMWPFCRAVVTVVQFVSGFAHLRLIEIHTD